MIDEKPECKKYLDNINGLKDGEVESRLCKKCLVNKPIDSFYMDKTRQKYWNICKLCKSRGPAKMNERAAVKSYTAEQRRNMGERKCLKCEQEFLSISKVNRLCNICNKHAQEDWQ